MFLRPCLRPVSLSAGRPVVLSSLLLALVLALSGCAKKEAAPEPLRAVRTIKVESGSVAALQEFSGEVKARTETRLSFRVGGKLLRREVDLGDAVRPGQAIAQLDPADLKLGQEAAAAGLRAAQVQAEQSAADLKRYRELHEQGFIGAAELERRETALKAAQAALDQARAQAGVQGNQAQYTRLVAEGAGVVTAVEAEPGAVVAAGTPIVRVALDGPRDVVFSVPEDRVAELRALMGRAGALQVRLWGGDGETLPATLRELAAAADASTRTFVAKADVGTAALRLGRTATVVMERPRRDGQIRLPLAAVAEQGGRSVVWLLDAQAMTVRPQPVRISGADGNQVLVAEGLQPGQEVVGAGVHVLTPGQKVRRYIEPARAASR